MANDEHVKILLEEGVEVWNRWREEHHAIIPDLSNADLRRADLRGAKLRDADFFGADLRRADLRDADLHRADLRVSKLHRAKLSGADLSGADLFGAKLRYAELRGADLRGAKLFGTELRRADLFGARLFGADLRCADLSDSNFGRADLSGVKFSGADLRGADLSGAYLAGAVLKGARLAEMVFDGNTYLGSVIVDAETLLSAPLFKRRFEDERFLNHFMKAYPRTAFIWWISSYYGLSMGLWAAWSLGFSIFFGILYSNWLPVGWRLWEFQFRAVFPWTFFSPFYFSIVTFTTLGFGDFTPMNVPAQIAVALEVILGYIMLGGLISIFANKLARRS